MRAIKEIFMMRTRIQSAFATVAALMLVATFVAACGDLTGPESPSTPTDVVATLSGSTSATIRWTPSPLNDGVISYSIFRNGTKVGESTTATYNDTGLATQTQYVYSVAANCKSGIVSDRSVETAAATVTTVDITAPTVSSRSPANGATNVAASGTTVTVTFSEPMNPATINATTFTLQVTGGAAIPGTVTYTPATRVAEFVPTGVLPNPASITATITAGAKDLAGNAIVATSWVFTTRDQTPPVVSSITPAAGAVGVAPGTAINITFNEAMDATTITNANITLRQTVSGAAVAGTVTYNATTRVATFTPSAPLAQTIGYTVTVSTAVKDAAGNALAAAFTSTFTVGDTTPPTVVSTVPADAATNVSTTAPITATFSEAMDPLTINGTTFTLRTTAGATPVAGTVTYNPATFVATFTPAAALAGSTGYTATITTGAKDATGNPLAAAKTWAFVTADVSAPTVTAVVPANNATLVGLNTTVKVTFSEAMDVTTITGANITLRTTTGGVSVSATVTYDAATFVATLTPNAPLAGNTNYTVTVTTGVKDASGNAMAAQFTSTFATLTPDTTAPTVTGVNPVNNATGISTATTVQVAFSESMDQATITATNITLKNTATSAAVAGTVSYNAATNVATFTPSGPLANSTNYTVTVTTEVKDLSGNPLASQFTSGFTTAAPLDNTAPTIISRSPTNGATAVAVSANGTITFSEPMNSATITTSTITLATTVGGTPVSSVVTYDVATNTATINPSADLASNTSYTLTVTTGVKDVAGNSLAANSASTFTTAPDNTAPTVLSRTPAGTPATGIARNTTVTFTFSESMDVATITGSTVTLVTTAGSVPVTGAVSYDVATRVATFTPSANLAASTSYTATVTTGAKDLAGNALAGNFSFAFTTGTTPP